MKLQFSLRCILAIALLLAPAACRSAWTDARRAPGFELSQSRPIRVAILPFEDRAGGRSPLVYPFVPFIWLANILTLSVPEGGPDPEKGARELRNFLAAFLLNSPVRALPSRATDTALAHRGLLANATKMDAVELGKLLDVDAILYGELLDWSGHYYIIESRTVVEARLRLVSCVDRRELFNITIGVSDAAGVSGGPTGYISAAATPLSALGKGPYADLAIAWATRAAQAVLRRDELLETPSNIIKNDPPPYIAAAAASPQPGGGFAPGDWIEVVALGAPGCAATFDVGTLHCGIPLVESARVPRPGTSELSGVYRGAFYVGDEDAAAEAPILVQFHKSGMSASRSADGPPVSIRPRMTAQSNLTRPPK